MMKNLNKFHHSNTACYNLRLELYKTQQKPLPEKFMQNLPKMS